MVEPQDPAVLLFSYGTLRDTVVQMANFGQLLSGRPDSLPGYTLRIAMKSSSTHVFWQHLSPA